MTSDNLSKGVIRMARRICIAEFKKTNISVVTEQSYKPKDAAKSLGTVN